MFTEAGSIVRPPVPARLKFETGPVTVPDPEYVWGEPSLAHCRIVVGPLATNIPLLMNAEPKTERVVLLRSSLVPASIVTFLTDGRNRSPAVYCRTNVFTLLVVSTTFGITPFAKNTVPLPPGE